MLWVTEVSGEGGSRVESVGVAEGCAGCTRKSMLVRVKSAGIVYATSVRSGMPPFLEGAKAN